MGYSTRRIAAVAVMAAGAVIGGGSASASAAAARWAPPIRVTPPVGAKAADVVEDVAVRDDGSEAVLFGGWHGRAPHTTLQPFDARGRLGKPRRFERLSGDSLTLGAGGSVAVAATDKRYLMRVLRSTDGWRPRKVRALRQGTLTAVAGGGFAWTGAADPEKGPNRLVRCDLPAGAGPARCGLDLVLTAGDSISAWGRAPATDDGGSVVPVSATVSEHPYREVAALVVARPGEPARELPMSGPTYLADASTALSGAHVAVAGIQVRHWGDAGPRGALWYAVGTTDQLPPMVEVPLGRRPDAMEVQTAVLPSGEAVLAWVDKDPDDGFADWGEVRYAWIGADGAIRRTGLLAGRLPAGKHAAAMQPALHVAGPSAVVASWLLLPKGRPSSFAHNAFGAATIDAAGPRAIPFADGRATLPDTVPITDTGNRAVGTSARWAVQALNRGDGSIELYRAPLG